MNAHDGTAIAGEPVDLTPSRIVYFVSDGTGVTAETLGSALLANFPSHDVEPHRRPFVDSESAARDVVSEMDRAAVDGFAPVAFMTIKAPAVASIVQSSRAVVIDLLGGPLRELERVLDTPASESAGQYHGVGDADRYRSRMRAVEYAIEHDDGQSVRALDLADVLIIAPSRCGKTPTTMYLALQFGLFVANFPLTLDDAREGGLPALIAPYARRCFGLTANPQRLSAVRRERYPNSRYASVQQCTAEVRFAEDLYRRSGVPYLDSSTRSVEEISAVILHTLQLRSRRYGRAAPDEGKRT